MRVRAVRVPTVSIQSPPYCPEGLKVLEDTHKESADIMHNSVGGRFTLSS